MVPIAELICELTRNCTIKEEYFAASFNLSPTEVRLLKLFSFSPKYTIKELRESLKLTPGRITHILTTLEEKKLITRVQDASDKRIILVNLTSKALPLITNLHQNYNDLHKRILENVDSSELKKITSALEILNDVFRKWVNQK
ncbi:MAG: MarR family transcriptional regulator [Ignavibacteriaceae bacterium]|nr:MarR family transcriptional regulator [Ignavibacterium sp.]MCC6254513.1 MarR family transcriptional regulator [Ignavibacteriaceae bacterium]HMN23545.1 MarR family transcriptional regulator [Ignavibacteriaceae bacterium]HRN25507.1 MarR family transcriptional regulator [Ignavibacteriaceae bacterium]HRP93198.1 MarR family transcriptional regulator [Ignavibacteriaceae bacterium]